jgi:hypothetical protein
MPADAEAHTYWYEHGVSVGYPTEYYEGQIWQVTVLYDWNWNAVAEAMMLHQPHYEGWRLFWWVHSPTRMYELSPETYYDWSPTEVSIGLYFLWRAAVSRNEPIFGPARLVEFTDGCTGLPFQLNFKGCCDSHDVHYLYGGDREHRRTVDGNFRECVRQRAQLWAANYGAVVSYMYWTGVRRMGCYHFNWTGLNPITGNIDCVKDCDWPDAQSGSFCWSACPFTSPWCPP